MIFEGLSAREAWERLSTVFERVAADCFCASANRRRGYIYMHTPVCKQELQNHECARSAERGTVNSFLEDKEPLEQG